MEGNFTFLQVLKLDDVELWQTKNNNVSCKARGHLQVLYSKLIDLFILRIADFQFALDKCLQIIGTLGEKDGYPSYLIPKSDGFFMIKVIDPNPGPIVTNFEAILENSCHFLLKTGMERRASHHEEGSSKLEKIESSIKEGFANLSKALIPGRKESHPNQEYIRSFAEIIDVNSKGVPVVDISRTEVQNLRDEAHEISKNYQDSAHWREVKSGSFLPKNKIAGTGLTSQSMGSIETITTMPTEDSRDQQTIVGSEEQRIPAYEIECSKQTLQVGFRRANSHFQEGFEEAPKLSVPSEQEDSEFTLGLFSSGNMTPQERDNRNANLNTKINKDKNVTNMDDRINLPYRPVANNFTTMSWGGQKNVSLQDQTNQP